MCNGWHGNPKPTVVVRARRVRRQRVLCSNIFPGITARLSKEQRIFVLTTYFETKSFKTVKQKFLQHFLHVPIPVNFTIMRLIDKYDCSRSYVCWCPWLSFSTFYVFKHFYKKKKKKNPTRGSDFVKTQLH